MKSKPEMNPKPLPSDADLDKAFKVVGDWWLHYYQLLFFHNPPLTKPGKNGYPFHIKISPEHSHCIAVEHSKPEFNFLITRGMLDAEVLAKCELILSNAHKPKINVMACCGLATNLSRPCVCAYAFECPIHGEMHIGTHD